MININLHNRMESDNIEKKNNGDNNNHLRH